MPAKEANAAIDTYMHSHVPVTEYQHLVKDKCVKCEEPIINPLENYEIRGNWCQTCNAKCRARKMSEAALNNLFRGEENQLYHDLYKDNIPYADLQKNVRKELGLDDVTQAAANTFIEI